jgi:hypothetical protein
MLRRKGLVIGAVLAAVLILGAGPAQAGGFGFAKGGCYPHYRYYPRHHAWHHHHHHGYPRYYGYAWRPSYGYNYSYYKYYGDRGTFTGGYYQYSR